ncbi:MAG: hypothetical protein GF349_03305 [Candidatus Magasanikbacteria bacterium]|nr:hypothetical protein [Candidatus Magasanikbacteria bacterium]
MTKLGKILLLIIFIGSLVAGLYYTGFLNTETFASVKKTVLEKIDNKKMNSEPVEAEIESESEASYAELVYTEGEVYKLRDEKPIQIEEGEIINKSDELKTNSNSKAEIIFFDNSRIRLAENTRIKIESMIDKEIIIKLIEGEVYNRVMTNDKRNYQIYYNDLISSALGTAFSLSSQDKKINIKVFESKVGVDYDENHRELDAGELLEIAKETREVTKMEMDLESELNNDFFKWNKQMDEDNDFEISIFEDNETEEKDEEDTGDKNITASIDGVNVSWQTDLKPNNGFKIIWSKEPKPSYPIRYSDKYFYYKNPEVRSGKIDNFDGDGKYYVRVCVYQNSVCKKYSNEVTTYLGNNTEKEEGESNTVNSITLNLEGSTANWSVDGYSPKGYKLLWSKNPKPSYPTRAGDKYAYYSNPNSRSGEVDLFDGPGTYYVRVCEYLGGKCGLYSNQVTVELGTAGNDEVVNSINLTVNADTASWSVDGYSPKGYKLLWSKNPEPTYPTRSGDKYSYLSNPDTRSGSLHAFDGPGTYYIRVCEYLGGACGVYSNQVTVELD